MAFGANFILANFNTGPPINIHGNDRIHRYYLEPGDYETDNEAELLEENFGNNEENEDGF
jgi:hypothetical protein